MEVYESHLGGIYFSESLLGWKDLYCEQCGDSDRHLGHADTWQDVLDLMTEHSYSEETVADWKGVFEAWIKRT